MKTPIQELIELIQQNNTISYSELLLRLRIKLKKEKEFAEKCFEAGLNRGIDNVISTEWGEDTTTPDFDSFYKEFENDN